MVKKAKSARLFGIFFILSFISYASGIGLMEAGLYPQATPEEVVESKISIAIGAVSIAFFHTLFNIGLIGIMYIILRSTNHSFAITYLTLGISSTLMLTIGAIFLLLPASIAETIMQTGASDPAFFSGILDLSSRANFYTYQFGMALWGVGGMVLCYLLNASKVVPRIFPWLGYVGYAIFITGCMLELFGLPYGTALSVPGGLFEITLSIWLIAKGFYHTDSITLGELHMT